MQAKDAHHSWLKGERATVGQLKVTLSYGRQANLRSPDR